MTTQRYHIDGMSCACLLYTSYYATPIILTGLSVGFAFKTGLFNIGTPGQFIVGAFAAVSYTHLDVYKRQPLP